LKEKEDKDKELKERQMKMKIERKSERVMTFMKLSVVIVVMQ
jgi:hypothetical protein